MTDNGIGWAWKFKSLAFSKTWVVCHWAEPSRGELIKRSKPTHDAVAIQVDRGFDTNRTLFPVAEVVSALIGGCCTAGIGDSNGNTVSTREGLDISGLVHFAHIVRSRTGWNGIISIHIGGTAIVESAIA